MTSNAAENIFLENVFPQTLRLEVFWLFSSRHFSFPSNTEYLKRPVESQLFLKYFRDRKTLIMNSNHAKASNSKINLWCDDRNNKLNWQTLKLRKRIFRLSENLFVYTVD